MVPSTRSGPFTWWTSERHIRGVYNGPDSHSMRALAADIRLLALE